MEIRLEEVDEEEVGVVATAGGGWFLTGVRTAFVDEEREWSTGPGVARKFSGGSFNMAGCRDLALIERKVAVGSLDSSLVRLVSTFCARGRRRVFCCSE